jgi:LmbE family N-acetylglucosaminyl deacetylase
MRSLREAMHQLRQLLANGLLMGNRLLGSDRLSKRLRVSSSLVFAPHPDDEVLGCGGTIALKALAGARLQVVVMTDGRASHRTLIPERELIRIRRIEAQEAGRRLGLKNEYAFLDFEDHRLSDSRDAACAQVVDIIDKFKPEEIYLPHRYDNISDHVATHRIVRSAVKRIGRPAVLFEYPIWLWNRWPWTCGGAHDGLGKVRGRLRTLRDVAEIVFACRTRIDVANVLQCKTAALAAYRSQTLRLNDDPRWPVLSDVSGGEFLRRFQTGIEIFRCTYYSA